MNRPVPDFLRIPPVDEERGNWKSWHVTVAAKWLLLSLAVVCTLIAMIFLPWLAHFIYRVNCAMSVGFMIPIILAGFLITGIAILCACLGTALLHHPRHVFIAIGVMAFIAVLFSFVVLPVAGRMRLARHHGVMERLVSQLEVFHLQHGYFPRTEDEFEANIRCGSRHVGEIGCCGGVIYRPLGEDKYEINYGDGFSVYRFQSDLRSVGWERAELRPAAYQLRHRGGFRHTSPRCGAPRLLNEGPRRQHR